LSVTRTAGTNSSGEPEPLATLTANQKRLLLVMILLWLVVFLRLSLWPFDFSRQNFVTFLPGKGLKFSAPSIAISDGTPSKLVGLDSFVVSISFYPDLSNGAGCILDYAPSSGPTNLRIIQGGDNLVVSIRTGETEMKHLNAPLGHRDSLNTFLLAVRGNNVSLTRSRRLVRSAMARTTPGSSWDPQAQLIFGSTASGKLRWAGTLTSFAVSRVSTFDSAFSPGTTLLSYRVLEYHDRVIPDEGENPKTPLRVPEQINAPARKILSSPLTYWDGIWNKSDLMYNVIAFLPLGFLLGILVRDRYGKVRLLLMAVVVAGLISLCVEIAQFYVPYRDSSIVDIVTDSFGSLCGAWIATLIPIRALLSLQKAGMTTSDDRT